MKQDERIRTFPFVGLLSKYHETWAITSFVLVTTKFLLIYFRVLSLISSFCLHSTKIQQQIQHHHLQVAQRSKEMVRITHQPRSCLAQQIQI